MRKAQGLLETIVAIGVIMTGLVSVMALTVSNLNTQREAATRYQAVNLAREGIELVRNQRDSNWLAQQDTWDGIFTTPSTDLPSPFSNFMRTVTVSGTTSDQRTVTAIVSWQQGGQKRDIKLTATLYDWK